MKDCSVRSGSGGQGSGGIVMLMMERNGGQR